MKKHALIFVIVSLLLVWSSSVLAQQDALIPQQSRPQVISGRVTDTLHQPIIGASVVIWCEGKLITATASDTDGRYRLYVDSVRLQQRTLSVTAVGYRERELPLRASYQHLKLDIICVPAVIEVGSISVRPAGEAVALGQVQQHTDLTRTAQQSLVPTNPLAALKFPQLARNGPSLSSQIRIDGTSPRYTLNNIPIGADPAHYGMFAIVPSSVVEEIRFFPQGTAADLALPSAVDLKTFAPFEKHHRGEAVLSAIEATGSYSLGNERWFALGSLRKSVLDKLVRQFDLKQNRRAIPPTNFQDIFFSTGLKISSRYRLIMDQYHVRDYLAYTAQTEGSSPHRISTAQEAHEDYVGVRLSGLYTNALLSVNGSVKSSRRHYQAVPDNPTAIGSMQVSLGENFKSYQVTGQADLTLGTAQARVGGQLEYLPARTTDLAHRNWNFLPPFANTDNPFVYQSALNDLYGAYHETGRETNSALYASVTKTLGNYTLENGLRLERYSSLSNGTRLLSRHRIERRLGESGTVELFHGTFAENPITTLLEPFQVMIRADARELAPLGTRLTSVTGAFRSVRLSLYTKQIFNVPSVEPDFENTPSGNQLNSQFLQMRSTGSASFVGGSVRLDAPHVMHDQMRFYVSYAYSRAMKTEHGVSVPYDLSAPHRFIAQLDCRVSRVIQVGGEVQIRSGNPYTPIRPLMLHSESRQYNESYYVSVLKSENSESFRANASLNLHATITFGNTELFLSIANATNRANPIVHSASGDIYDVGLMPSIGVRTRL